MKAKTQSWSIPNKLSIITLTYIGLVFLFYTQIPKYQVLNAIYEFITIPILVLNFVLFAFYTYLLLKKDFHFSTILRFVLHGAILVFMFISE